MISNERPSPFGRQPYFQRNFSEPRPPVIEDTLHCCELQIERKFYVLTLKENPRGRFLRITEGGGYKRNTIIIPATGLKDFQKLLADMMQAESAIAAKKNVGLPG